MKYIVLEIQKFADGTIAVPPINTYENFFDALARYHTILAVAAKSDVPLHSAVILNDAGQELRMDSYDKSSGQND